MRGARSRRARAKASGRIATRAARHRRVQRFASYVVQYK
ncbi:hypothetical protein BURPS1106A_A1735 [Burkholderia pseudomallei 1106a]|uniref:Uncharacterized protein n=1 Tax=Burkholderia pseudomallei (strain 1106a) TaxID=357348 RepID=A3P609_BURP0|nr:hypothetical protein BURPS1106A_A1735 [Burkholderia pseudomallei 1106a]